MTIIPHKPAHDRNVALPTPGRNDLPGKGKKRQSTIKILSLTLPVITHAKGDLFPSWRRHPKQNRQVKKEAAPLALLLLLFQLLSMNQKKKKKEAVWCHIKQVLIIFGSKLPFLHVFGSHLKTAIQKDNNHLSLGKSLIRFSTENFAYFFNIF